MKIKAKKGVNIQTNKKLEFVLKLIGSIENSEF